MVRVEMTDKDVILQVALLLGERPVYESKRREPHKTCYATYVSGEAAADVMLRISPMMGERRKARILSIVDEWRSREEEAISRNHADPRRVRTGKREKVVL